MNGARFIRHDLSLVVEELLEEQEEQRKRAVDGARTPVLQMVNTDFSYGPVQVLFDVNFEIHRGECVALLGTNGAGKSTILRVHQRARSSRARRAAAQRPQHHVRRARATREARHRAAARRQGRVPEPHGDAEPAVAARPARAAPRPRSTRASPTCSSSSPSSRSAASSSPRSLSGGQQQMLALGAGAHAGARDPAHRRAVARPRARSSCSACSSSSTSCGRAARR